MNNYLKNCTLACFFLFPSLIASAQYDYAENAKGKIESLGNNEWLFKRVDALKLPASKKSTSLKKCLAEQLNIINHSPIINPPLGFNTKTFFSIEPGNGLLADANIDVDFYYLMHDKNTGAVKVSQDGTAISLLTNNIIHLCEQQGNFWQDCSKLKIPEFFEAFPVTDSTADYVELNFENYGYAHTIPPMPIRIVKRNNKPLFIPLTRKEYVQYVVAKKKSDIAERQKDLKDLQKEITAKKSELNEPAYQSIKETLLKVVSNLESQVQPAQLEIRKQEDQLEHFTDVLNHMPASEAKMAARLDENKSSTDNIYDLTQLVSPGRYEGVQLNKINPDYVDKSPNAPGAQLIMVTTSSSLFSVPGNELNYLQKKTLQLFNQLDYHRLKESMN